MSENGSSGLKIYRHLTKDNERYGEIAFAARHPVIKDSNGSVIFEREVVAPSAWSDRAVKVVSSKYLYKGGKEGLEEKDIRQMISGVSDTISEQAGLQGVIDKDSCKIFADELSYLSADQRMAFNSPVWFNVRLNRNYKVKEGKTGPSSHYSIVNGEPSNMIDAYERPQASACFIQSIEDNMEDILEHTSREGMLFKYGSGTGTNFSTLRGTNEPLSGGGVASGLISFMRIYDIIAGRIQSGGKTRRAAKMVICDADHPDIYRFINWKMNEEKKALWLCANPNWAPRDSSDLESEAYKTVDGQNGNNTVRVSDDFMNSVLNDETWDLKFITGNRVPEEVEIPFEEYKDDRYLPDRRFLLKVTNKKKVTRAKNLWEQIVRAAYVVGDPALQYKDNINRWNTCKNSGEIRASNPCSEFVFLDDSACNLASLNLMKFRRDDGSFDVNDFRQAVRTTIIAQETLVDYGSYPSAKIARNSHNFRPLGLGYTNMGALLMSWGVPYDSDEGRTIASSITALMTGVAYETSIELAQKKGAFNEYGKNRDSMLRVINLHREHIKKIDKTKLTNKLEDVINAVYKSWENVGEMGEKYGFRNAQVTLLAPTGTIGFMMDVDCTGIESMLGLVTVKGLAGGGKMELETGRCVKQGLETLEYSGKNLEDILSYIKEKGSVIGAPHLKEEHYKVFATSLGENTVSVDGHLNMMAAVQPYLSGAISKTVNLPKGSKIEDVQETFMKGWKLGLKSVALYVDGSKGVQPVNIVSAEKIKSGLKWGERLKPENPIERIGWNVDINGTGVHIMVGEYRGRKPSEAPADFFVEFGSSGSTYAATYTSWAKELSRDRQRGDGVEDIIKHNLGANGSVFGFTDHPFIKQCSSIEDMLAKILKLEYLGQTDHCQTKPTPEQIDNLRCNVLARVNRNNHYRSRIQAIDSVMTDGKIIPVEALEEDTAPNGTIKSGTPFCPICGHKTIPSGANCFKCENCGDSSSCG